MASNHLNQRKVVYKSNDNFARCKPKPSKLKKVLLECGQGTGSRTFTSSDALPFQLAHMNIDTRSLNKGKVLIKFSSIVNMETLAAGATVRLKYELFRVCNSDGLKSLGTWDFEEIGVAPPVFDSQEESFSFIFCECKNLEKCCEYFVVVTPLEITNAIATVSNGRIGAIAQSLDEPLNNECEIYDFKYNCLKSEIKATKPKEVILVCGQGNGNFTFRQATISQPPVTIANVTIDTTCLYRPKIFIDFSSIINVDFRVLDVRLKFELFRVCRDEQPLSLGTWAFEREDTNLPLAVDKAFTFVFCEDIPCPGCCEYFVTVEGIELNVGPPSIYLGVTLGNARITAIAQSSRDDYYEEDKKKLGGKKDCDYCPLKSPKPKKILLECGMGTGSRTFSSSNDSAFQLAHTTIDTTSLCKPIVNIEFSSIVSFERIEDDGIAELRYELFRACDNREPVSLGIWILGRVDFTVIDKSTNTFDFTFCDCVTCPGCCNYFVTVTPTQITEGLITATVSNGRMAALAGEG